MLNPIDFFKTELLNVLDSDVTSVSLPDNAASELCAQMSVGTQIPLIISASGLTPEVILIESATDKVFTITRGAFGTTAVRWPAGSCVQSGWTTALLEQFICEASERC